MILAAFDHPTVDIQVAVLKMLPVIVNLIEYDTLKNAILPKIQVRPTLPFKENMHLNMVTRPPACQ